VYPVFLDDFVQPETKWIDTPAPGGYILRTCVWTRAGTLNGSTHQKGDPLRTWEVMAMEGLATSYALSTIPQYKVRFQRSWMMHHHRISFAHGALRGVRVVAGVGFVACCAILQVAAMIDKGGDLEQVLERWNREYELRDSLFPEESWAVNPLLFLDPVPPPTPPPVTTVPDPPIITSITSQSQRVQLSWLPPKFDGGKRITSYAAWLVFSDPVTGEDMMFGRQRIQMHHPDIDGPQPNQFTVTFTNLQNGITCVEQSRWRVCR